MIAYYNGRYISEEKISLSIENRGFLYGDGFFETMIGIRGRVRLLSYHLARLRKGMAFTRMRVGEELSDENCASIVAELFRINNISVYARIKIMVWRSGEGNYLPSEESSKLLIVLNEIDKPGPHHRTRAVFSDSVRNFWSETSQFKTLSSQKYVLAGLEMKEKGGDEIVIKDADEHISECLHSNIFWVKKGNLFTPPLTTGGVNGVFRSALAELTDGRFSFEERLVQQEELLLADSIFCTNAVSCSHILNLQNKSFRPYREINRVYEDHLYG